MINPGTLVLTSEGYYGIVLGPPTSHGYVDVFTSNGLRLIEHEDALKPLGLKHDSTSADPSASFNEILKDKPTLVQECGGFPPNETEPREPSHETC